MADGLIYGVKKTSGKKLNLTDAQRVEVRDFVLAVDMAARMAAGAALALAHDLSDDSKPSGKDSVLPTPYIASHIASVMGTVVGSVLPTMDEEPKNQEDMDRGGVILDASTSMSEIFHQAVLEMAMGPDCIMARANLYFNSSNDAMMDRAVKKDKAVWASKYIQRLRKSLNDIAAHGAGIQTKHTRKH